LIKKPESMDKYVAIAGFRNVKVKNVKNFFASLRKEIGETEIQFFDAKLIASREHLYFAALNALKAFQNRLNISKSLAVETLLYASAQRQITKAVDLLGIKPSSTEVAVLVIGKTELEAKRTLEIVSKQILGERDDRVLELSNEKMEGIEKLFDISDIEFKAKLTKKGMEKEALIDLVIEHMALLVTQR